MSISNSDVRDRSQIGKLLNWGVFWFLIALIGAGLFFADGINTLLKAWQLPEYSHGPLIPVLSALLFLRQLKEIPVQPGPKNDRLPGVFLVIFSLLFGVIGILSNIHDIVAYALILWVGGIVLISWGWNTGKLFWPPVLHLVYMLPLPDTIYYKTTTYLQFISSEMGVWFLRLLSIPVFLDGNIIDLGVLKLHVAEACSGLRYMFPILSFSYIFAVLYRGPVWHKAVLLLSAVPIAILMNSVRIAVAGIIVQQYGIEWLDGFTHFFEGWVIFLACILLLFGIAWVMLLFRQDKVSLVEALDLDTDGLGTQFMRLQYLMPSKALIAAAVCSFVGFAALQAMPERDKVIPDRETFALFPRTLDGWQQQGSRTLLSRAVEINLAADDYHQVTFAKPDVPGQVNLFMAWYKDQTNGGIHSPEVCLPGAGWEIAWLERTDITESIGSGTPFWLNRAIIQKSETRMMVYYWFQQRERRIARDYAAKMWLLVDGVRTGRTDGALIRLTTLIAPGESDAEAEARLQDMLVAMQDSLPRFIPVD
jgi:exosortase D (VPLPA-CTERM-specific)